MDHGGAIVGMIVLGAVFVLLMAAFRYARGQSILDQWASENGYEILSRERRLLMVGPFWWRKSKDQIVYYVTVRTSGSELRRGWVRCGGWFLGLWSGAADVEWDE